MAWRITLFCDRPNCFQRPIERVTNEVGDYGDFCERHADERMAELEAEERAAQSPADTQKAHFDEAFGAKP